MRRRLNMQIKLDNTTITFEVQFSKRKKISLEVSPEGYMTVRAPSKTSETEIINFMHSNATRLLEIQTKLDNRKYISSQKTYHSEELFLYLGRACHLNELLNPIPETEELIPQQLQKFYMTQTKKIVKKRVKHFEKVISVKAKSITVVDSPRTWGTCSSRKELTFNYKLSMAPMIVIDYVVIHELCHILHLNHDRSFWRKVGTYDPNYKQNQDYLSKFGNFMTI